MTSSEFHNVKHRLDESLETKAWNPQQISSRVQCVGVWLECGDAQSGT